MGTSSIYDGPKDKNQLLPEGFEDEYEGLEKDTGQPNDEDEPRVITTGSWQEAKKSMSQYITGSSSSRGRVIRSYIGASGGAKASAKRAVSGKQATIQLGRLLSNIYSDGIIRTLEKLKIDYKGKSVESLLSEMVNVISVNSNTKEDVVAKNATIEALSELYEYVEANNMDINTLDSMDGEVFDKIMSSFFSDYIFNRMLNDLQSRFEIYAENIQEALTKEKEMKDYITESVDVKLRGIDFNGLNYNGSSIDSVIENIYKECYEVLEVYL